MPKSESCLDIDGNGSTGHCLVDTGCDKSVIPLPFIPRAKLRQTSLRLFAANGTEIKVLGAVRFNFRVKGMPLHADLVVSDEIDEFILGFDWLKQNKCRWMFDQAVLEINGTPIPLKTRPSRACVRRVYVKETVVLPNETQVNVPVRMPITSWRSPN